MEEEMKIEKILEDFEETFELKRKEMLNAPLLKILFREFIETIYKPTENYYKNLSEISEIEKEIEETFSTNEKILFKKWNFKQDRRLDERVEQAFIYGYAISSQIDSEKNDIIKKYE